MNCSVQANNGDNGEHSLQQILEHYKSEIMHGGRLVRHWVRVGSI